MKLNLIIILAIFLFVGLACVPPDKRTDGNASVVSQSPPLKLLSSRGEIEYDYVTVKGEVQNISSEKLDDVWIVVTQYGADGALINSETSIIEYQPLMPGQTSPFRSMMRHNPLMKTYTIGFKHFIGGEIQYIDARTTKTDSKTKKSK